MLFYIHHRGTEYRIRVELRHGQTYVRFNDEPEQPVDISFYGHDCTFIHDNSVFSANILGEKNDYTVFHPQGNLTFQVESEYRRIVGILRGQTLTNENNIYAKMPGKIAKILVQPGADVAAGDPVLVMEAMKMENEIRSPRSGKVRTLHIKEGQAVETGVLLAEIEPGE